MWKFLAHYRNLLDQPKASAIAAEPKHEPNKKDKKDKKAKKEKKEKKSKEKKSKKDKSKKSPEIPAQPVQEPNPEQKVTRYHRDWLQQSFEIVLSSLAPPNKFLTTDQEKILLRVWLFAEEEDNVRHLFAASVKNRKAVHIIQVIDIFILFFQEIGWRIPLIGGYFAMIPAREFLNKLDEDLMEILKPYKDDRLEVSVFKKVFHFDTCQTLTPTRTCHFDLF